MSLVMVADPIPFVADADGIVRVGGTRVTLDTVVTAFREGASPETIADQYPALGLADVYTALGYYLRHQADVDAYLQRRRQQVAQVREENETRFNPIGVRERLLARRNPPG